MNKELFGVFGDRSAFERHRSNAEFDRVVEGPSLTVGVRDDGLGVPNRTHVAVREDACCVVWGEAYLPANGHDPADWLLDQYPNVGSKALDSLSGSFLAVVDDGYRPAVVTDPLRTRECFYTDAAGPRAFGTDPAAVVDVVDDPSACRRALQEFVHLGVVLGDRTLFEELSRVPFDGYLEPDAVGELARFVYDAEDFDYVTSLARRLRRAIERRSGQPGRTGVLLSAGYDSRLLLAELDGLEASYTLGTPGSDEVDVARAVAEKYDVDHRVLAPGQCYLNTDPETVQYGQGVRESLQVHHAIDGASIDLDSLHHGLLFDTLLAGHFRPRRGVSAFGHTLPLRGLEPDPDVAETLLFENFGFWRLSDHPGVGDDVLAEDSVAFCRDAIEAQRDRLADRFERPHDAVAAVGIQNQPTMPFHAHLADNFFATFVAADAELVDWHLRTPPEHRNERTYRRALERLDASLLSPRPPDRPHDRYVLNQIEKFLRRTLPGLDTFESAWPDRREHYRRTDLDERLFVAGSGLRDLPPRVKLRFNDAVCWLDVLADGPRVDSVDALVTPANVE
ncbi:asparagine synthase-related protein [Halobacterium yunchengense]|uniref:asparagine synthase-related protein n=1 Tax=Halobacterium yunchengense TaxID=3108497 RepID=UPI00300A299E